jgi:ketosteroid isomerase-like protein
VTPSDTTAVLRANQSLYDAFETGDADLMAALWLDGPDAATVSCVHPGWSPLHGLETVLRSWTMIMANTSFIQFVLTDVEVTVAGEVAVVTCGENMLTGLDDVTGGDIGGLAGGRAVATNVFRRTPEGWRLWVHHASPVLTRQDADIEVDREQ